MKRVFTLGELLEGPHDWEHICSVLDLNPWLINEGLAEEDEEVTITEEQWDLIIDPPGPMYDHPRLPMISAEEWGMNFPDGYASPTELWVKIEDLEKLVKE